VAQIFIRTAEHAMQVSGISFEELPARLVSQFCYILLGRIATIDPNTSGQTIFKIELNEDNKVTAHQLSDHEIFPERDAREISHFAEFVEEAMKAIPRDNIERFVRHYKISIAKMIEMVST